MQFLAASTGAYTETLREGEYTIIDAGRPLKSYSTAYGIGE